MNEPNNIVDATQFFVNPLLLKAKPQLDAAKAAQKKIFTTIWEAYMADIEGAREVALYDNLESIYKGAEPSVDKEKLFELMQTFWPSSYIYGHLPAKFTVVSLPDGNRSGDFESFYADRHYLKPMPGQHVKMADVAKRAPDDLYRALRSLDNPLISELATECHEVILALRNRIQISRTVPAFAELADKAAFRA